MCTSSHEFSWLQTRNLGSLQPKRMRLVLLQILLARTSAGNEIYPSPRVQSVRGPHVAPDCLQNLILLDSWFYGLPRPTWVCCLTCVMLYPRARVIMLMLKSSTARICIVDCDLIRSLPFPAVVELHPLSLQGLYCLNSAFDSILPEISLMASKQDRPAHFPLHKPVNATNKTLERDKVESNKCPAPSSALLLKARSLETSKD